MRPLLLRHLALPGVLLALAVVQLGGVAVPGRALWPWSDSLATAAQLEAMHLAWLGEGSLTRGALAWPLDGAVTQVDWLGGLALLSLPLHALGLHPVDVHAWVSALGLVATGLACHAVARALLGPGLHTWVAAVFGAFHPLSAGHLPYANLTHSELGVGGALLLGWGLKDARPRLAALGALLVGGAGWMGFYKATHAALMGAVVVIAALVGRRGDRRSYLAVAGGLLVGLASFAPVARVYATFQRRHGVGLDRRIPVGESYDPGWPTTFLNDSGVPGGGGVAVASGAELGPVAVGLALVLAALGAPSAWRRGPRWAWGAVLALGLLSTGFAMGSELRWQGVLTGIPGPGRVLAWLPGMSGLRAPIRWLGVTWMALAVLAAGGAAALGRLRGGRVLPLVVAAALAALLVRPVVSEPREALRLHPLYERVAEAAATGALLDRLPREGQPDAWGCHLGHRLLAQMGHHRPLVGVLVARRVGALTMVSRRTSSWPSPRAAALLRRMGVGLVLEHSPVAEVRLPGVRCEELEGHRLCELEPWPEPLVRHQDLEEVDSLPVDALAFAEAPSSERHLEVRCDGEALRFVVDQWRVLTRARTGETGPALQVQLGRRCAQELEVTSGEARWLRARTDARPWP